MKLANILKVAHKFNPNFSGISNFVRTVTNFQSNPNSSCVKRGTLNKKEAAGNKVLIDGINLYWKKFGDGPIVALLLPGLVGSVQSNYLPVIKKMNLDKFTLIGWDPPGYGFSRPPERNVFTEENCLGRDARLAHSLMKELGYDKFSVVGWSNGGTTGALIAAAYPDSVEKVVMCNAATACTERTVNVMEAMVDLNNWTHSQRKVLLRAYEKDYVHKMLMDWKIFCQREAKTGETTRYITTELKKILAPSLYIKSAEDYCILMEEVESNKNLMRNLTIHMVDKGGHDHLEFLDEFVAVTEDFLSE